MSQGFNGWGNEGWGLAPWGGSVATALTVLSAQAAAENAVLVQMSLAVYYTQWGDTEDASTPSKWSVTPAPGTSGYDGNAARAVTVLSVAIQDVEGAPYGSWLLLTLDRPMTPFPAQYTVGCEDIYSADGTQEVLAGANSAALYGVYRELTAPDPSVPTPARDISNPQTLAQAQASTAVNPSAASALATFGYSADGDYAIDKAEQSYLKRIWRRTVTKPGGFVHLGMGYGVGVTTYGKRLGRAVARDQLAAACEQQYGQEPETAQALVVPVPDPVYPQMVRLSINLKKKSGSTSKYTMRVPMGT